jgi:tetratricopeptide (TPR) repeat protein
MQTNLFSDDQLCKNDFIRSINIFSLEKALSILDKWRSAYSQLQNISEIEKSLIQLILDYEKAENKNEFLLALYTDNESAESYKGLVQYFRYVKEGLLYKLAELNPNADYYLKDGFHISEVYLKLEQYAAVEKSCELALKKIRRRFFIASN